MRFKFYMLAAVLACALSGAGCSGIPGSFSYDTKGNDYFTGEFQDIPIPKEMNNCSETTIVTTPNNLVTGVQVYKGRVEVNSLLRAMPKYLKNSGWTLRSSTRSTKSVLLFEKNDKYCILYVLDGTIFTEMQVFVTPKLLPGNEQQASGNLPTMTLPVIEPAVKPGGAAAPAASASPSSSFDSHTLSE